MSKGKCIDIRLIFKVLLLLFILLLNSYYYYAAIIVITIIVYSVIIIIITIRLNQEHYCLYSLYCLLYFKINIKISGKNMQNCYYKVMKSDIMRETFVEVVTTDRSLRPIDDLSPVRH